MYPLENVTMEQEKMVKQPCISGNGQGGYNLLQMAMSILILGILAGFIHTESTTTITKKKSEERPTRIFNWL
jgi:hypothetical protein